MEQTEQQLRVLLHCAGDDPGAFRATFSPRVPKYVREVTEEDLQSLSGPYNDKRIRALLAKLRVPEQARQSVFSTLDLVQAVRRNDDAAIKKALADSIRMENASARRVLGAWWDSQLEGLSAKEKRQRRMDELCREVTEGLDGVRLVLYVDQGQFVPALLCRHVGDAVFVRILLLEAGGEVINRCVKCSAFFTSQRSTRRYCSPAHRDADRAARWRARKKQSKHATSSEQHRSHGSQVDNWGGTS